MSFLEELKHLQIPLQDILLATNQFSDEDNLIAVGGFGKVYRGKSDKHGIIAVKRLDRSQGQGDREFLTEIDMLSSYKHENIVSLHGFCNEASEKILVYKHERNGSLDKHINSKDLNWTQRLQICLDAARGLKYLHDDVGPLHRIIHRDIKTSNILLDENMKAKISDFGLSKTGPANVERTFLISNACGTIGYVDPEYIETAVLTKESDVYSFGVVLFEVLCGRLARVKDERLLLSHLAQKHYESDTLDEIIPSYLQINAASLTKFSNIAYQCLRKREERPTMTKVVERLQKAMDDQLNGERNEGSGNNTCENDEKKQRIDSRSKQMGKQVKENSDSVEAVAKGSYIHVRARRGQATNSHSLAERARREKIGERMKLLQELVPGCNKLSGKAVMLDEIINYVQSLQQQVEATRSRMDEEITADHTWQEKLAS